MLGKGVQSESQASSSARQYDFKLPSAKNGRNGIDKNIRRFFISSVLSAQEESRRLNCSYTLGIIQTMKHTGWLCSYWWVHFVDFHLELQFRGTPKSKSTKPRSKPPEPSRTLQLSMTHPAMPQFGKGGVTAWNTERPSQSHHSFTHKSHSILLFFFNKCLSSDSTVFISEALTPIDGTPLVTTEAFGMWNESDCVCVNSLL